MKTAAEAEKKTGELVKRGVTDFTIVQDDVQWRYAIALGSFPTEEAANAHLAQLRQKTVRSAVVGTRNAGGGTFVIRDPGDAAAAKIAELKSEFPNGQLKAAACAVPQAAKN